MLSHFSEKPRAEFRALQIWQILISAAHNRQILTYKMLANMMGYAGAGVLGGMLGHIAYFCNQNHLPPLTSLVVKEDTGLPGGGIPVAESASKREDVFNYKWFDLIPPTPAELKDAFEKGE